MDYSTMAMDALLAEFISLGDQLSVIAEQRRQINEIMEARKREASTLVRLGALTTLQRDALSTVLRDTPESAFASVSA